MKVRPPTINKNNICGQFMVCSAIKGYSQHDPTMVQRSPISVL
jgi:hypothetical protein